MAHTDRDNARHFWKRHYGTSPRGGRWGGECTLYTQYGGRWGGTIRGHCWCDSIHTGWTRPYKYEQGLPTWFNKDCRREERARARNMLNRARNGNIDWDDLTISYRRPYYW